MATVIQHMLNSERRAQLKISVVSNFLAYKRQTFLTTYQMGEHLNTLGHGL